MCGVLQHFATESDRGLLACDSNASLIQMWKEYQSDNWTPPDKCSREHFKKLKCESKPSPDKGFLGSVCSWGGIWFVGYRCDYNKTIDFIAEGIRGMQKIKPFIKNVQFVNARSYKLFNPTGMVIYCDPPYAGNTFKNIHFKKFNQEEFWQIMREWSVANIVFISNSTGPSDFVQIWSNKSNVVGTNKNKVYNEYLFLHDSVYNRLSV